MNEEQKDILFDLLTKKAIYGLNEAEQAQLDDLDTGTADLEFRSLEITAAAISLAGLTENEPMPVHLYSKILANADQHLVFDSSAETVAWPPTTDRQSAYGSADEEKLSTPWFSWFGWAAAAAACIALAVNIWFTRTQSVEIVQNQPPVNASKTLNAVELRDDLLKATKDVIKAAWGEGNVKGLTQVVGDVVWSDEKQAGYMTLKGLPANDKAKETYQLWIFDKTQDPKTPIDGGTFDVNSDGEVVIPINAKLKALKPEMFAITVEKPGGVVVSQRGKISAIAKVETQTKPTA